ncbi:kynurenine formamidase [Caldalkalibacillus uzonensis]|uniref:Kynurenine formamidase n=1 Tax=Caldalkalibacillus uzonensis TaxID=353224 RepID=A0ABU0CXR3_9BACI|nr:cyclase family protein [Caldalkalibacillus uzonensis]MDQ0340847.1 kynurenine formamidase [Caldalkalibacillus uzonensis]
MAKLANIKAEDFPDKMALATEIITASAHSGTHVDAPYHYGPICEGKPARTIDQIPLDWCFGPGVVLDMRHKEPGTEITVEDMKRALEKINYKLKPKDIVLLYTGCDEYWGTDTETYLRMQSGLGVAGLDWLLDQGIRCIGIDAWTLDRPIHAMVASYQKTKNKSHLWPTHMHGRKREYIQIEKMANLGKIPQPYGFLVSALPVKFEGCSGGWCRAVAIIKEKSSFLTSPNHFTRS